MGLKREEVLALVQEYMGLTPKDKGLRSVLSMSDELTDKIMKLEGKKGDRDLVDKK